MLLPCEPTCWLGFSSGTCCPAPRQARTDYSFPRDQQVRTWFGSAQDMEGCPYSAPLDVPLLWFVNVSNVRSNLSRLIWCSSTQNWFPLRSLFIDKDDDVTLSLLLMCWSCEIPYEVSLLTWGGGCWWRICDSAAWSRRISSSINRICHDHWVLYKNGRRSNRLSSGRIIFGVVGGGQGRHFVPVDWVGTEEAFNFLCHVYGRVVVAPSVDEFAEHAVRTAAGYLPKTTEHGEFVIGHTHVLLPTKTASQLFVNQTR